MFFRLLKIVLYVLIYLSHSIYPTESFAIDSKNEFQFLRCTIFDNRNTSCCSFLEPKEKYRYNLCNPNTVTASERQKIFDQCMAWRGPQCCDHLTQSMKDSRGGCKHLSFSNAGPRPKSINDVAYKIAGGPICFGNACKSVVWKPSNGCTKVGNRGSNDIVVKFGVHTIEIASGSEERVLDLSGNSCATSFRVDNFSARYLN